MTKPAGTPKPATKPKAEAKAKTKVAGDPIFFPKFFGTGTVSGLKFTFDRDVEGGGEFQTFGPTIVVIEASGRHPRSGGTFDGRITLRATTHTAELVGTMNGQPVAYRGKCEIRGDRLFADFHHDVYFFVKRSAAHPDRADCSYGSSESSIVPGGS